MVSLPKHGTPWVFIPGAWSTAGFIEAMIPAGMRAQLVIEPLPECRTDAPKRTWGRWRAGHAWVHERLNTYHQHHGPMVLFSHSFGAQYILDYAHTYPERVAAVVLTAPTLGRWWVLHSARNLLAVMHHPQGQWWARLMLGKGEHLTPRRTVIRGPNLNPPKWGAMAQIFTLLSQLGRASSTLPACPTLVILARDDHFVTPRNPIKNATVWEVTGGHFRFIAEPALWVRVQSWLGQHGVR
jgi:pimeloyl-ACP methyl ester carboxylesterase